MKEVYDFPKWDPFGDRIIDTSSDVERAIISAIEAHNSDIFMDACFARHDLIRVFEHNIGEIGFHEEPFNIESCFDINNFFRPQEIIFPVGSLIAASARSHYPELPIIINIRKKSNQPLSYKQNILTEKLWEEENLKLERMEFIYKNFNEEELYFKKLKGKFNPSGRSMKQHYNILKLNKRKLNGL